MGVRTLDNLDVMKCRCRGSNAACLHCFGTGIITETEPTQTLVFKAKQPTMPASPSILDPKFVERPSKLSLEQAIMFHGTHEGDQKAARRFAKAVHAVKSFRDADPHYIGPHADAVLDSIKSALNFDKRKFRRFMFDVEDITRREGVTSREKAKLLTIRSALLHGSLKFTPEQVSVLDEAFRTSTKGIDANQDKPFRIQLIALKDRLKTLESKISAPDKAPTRNSGLVLMLPDNQISDGQAEQVMDRINERNVDHVFFFGTENGFDAFKAVFPQISTHHVKDNAELKTIMASTSIGTLKLQSESNELKL